MAEEAPVFFRRAFAHECLGLGLCRKADSLRLSQVERFYEIQAGKVLGSVSNATFEKLEQGERGESR